MNNKFTLLPLRAAALLALCLALAPCSSLAQGTAFTYQGQLYDGTNVANGRYDFTFAVFGGATGGSPVTSGGPVTNPLVSVSNGLFTVTLDFGSSPFSFGSLRWLEVGVRTNGGSFFTTLSPRQKFNATPYAITAGNLTGTIGNTQLSNNSLTITAGTGLTGGGTVALGGSTTLNNGGVISVTGNTDVIASPTSGAVTLSANATSNDTGSTLVKRDPSGSFTASSITLDNLLHLPATQTAGLIFSGGSTLIHTFGQSDFFAGVGAGNLTLTGRLNTGVGAFALESLTSGEANTGVGLNALASDTSGINNTAVGLDALASSSSGSNNTAIGTYCLQNNTTGFNNTALGFEALEFNNVGVENVALGYRAMDANKTGADNTVVGFNALPFSTNSSQCTAVGANALQVCRTGQNNIAVGVSALSAVTSGANNIAIGNSAGTAISTGQNNIYIGNAGFGNESDVIRIGATQTKAVMLGISSNVVASGGAAVYVNASGLLGTILSTARVKQNIQTMADASDELLKLHPVTFQYKKEFDPLGAKQFGLVAEEVEQVDPALVSYDDHHRLYTVRYEAVNAMLLNEFLKEHHKVETQSAELGQQAKEIQDLKSRLGKLETLIGAAK